MENIAHQLSNVTLYDVKKYVRKAQNAVLNVTDMEAKVREATNNEPWATSTTMMQQIADATNNYQQFHEIMPFVYRRFSEKSASEWRQIYKSLQLLDFLVRNGSEKVVDYARSHLSVVEMLRHFSYIDSKGVDQGASIRKRSEELVELLNSNERLRSERKKAKQLNAKTGLSSRSTTGVYANDQFGGAGGFGGSGSRYGGFSSDTYRQMRFSSAASGAQGFGGASGYNGSTHNHTSANGASGVDNDEFEEYNVGGKPSQKSGSHAQPSASQDDDDDFADFQTAPSTQTAKPASSNILDLFDIPVSSNQTTSSSSANFSPATIPQSTSSGQSANLVTSPSKPAPNSQNDLFDSLWKVGKTYSTTKSDLKPTNGSANNSNVIKPQTSTTTSSATTNKNSDVVDLLSF